jgi:predicted amidohydrolase YtcJ
MSARSIVPSIHSSNAWRQFPASAAPASATSGMMPKVLSGRESHARVSNDGAFKQVGKTKKSGPAAAPRMIRHAGGTSCGRLQNAAESRDEKSKTLFK